MSQNLKVGIIIGCFVLSGGILYFTTFRGSGGGDYGSDKVWIKCFNPDCNQVYEIKYDEFAKMQNEVAPEGMGPMMMMPGQGPIAYNCLKCGKRSAYMAQKCEKKGCGNVFVSGEARDEQYPDRCPKCGYSAIEEMSKQQ